MLVRDCWYAAVGIVRLCPSDLFQCPGGTAGRRWLSEAPPAPAAAAGSTDVQTGSRLRYLASLSVDTPPTTIRRTGIVCTIGR